MDTVYEITRIDKKNNKAYLVYDAQRDTIPLDELISLFDRRLYKEVDNNFSFNN